MFFCGIPVASEIIVAVAMLFVRYLTTADSCVVGVKFSFLIVQLFDDGTMIFNVTYSNGNSVVSV
jgi:hypothetical protein